jgi:hypothetical protein
MFFSHYDDGKGHVSLKIEFTFSEFIILRHLLCIEDIRSCKGKKPGSRNENYLNKKIS